MQWEALISDRRLGLEDIRSNRAGERSDFQRDFDRLVFSSPFRRLQNKTQVFPLPGSIFVHNRLTHSMEVACVGRSLANDIAAGLRPKYASEPWIHKLDAIGEIVAAACLAHDLGNPPFGHSGEKAIATYFSEGPGLELQGQLDADQWSDFINFEGNANAFRLLTHQFKGRREGGFAMTYSTLASIVKYPYQSSLAGARCKFGFFASERDTFVKVADALGMLRMEAPEGAVRYARHPLVYIMEAADDICYEIMDIEDAHKLRILSHDEVIDHFLNFFEIPVRNRRVEMMTRLDDPNEKVAYLRSSVIGTLVNACAEAFIANEEAILSGRFRGPLVQHIADRPRRAYESCSKLSYDKIYGSSDVVDIELAGNRIISFLVDALIEAVRHPHLNYSRLLLSQVPQQYDVAAPTLYGKIQAALDHVSGMTDVYALDLYRKLNGMSLKINN
ncbi:MAG: dehydrogenase [Candidatus Amulumruptor caecigallinarius]|uniref:DNTP triphosphohydrolase n=1 Tax=Candidatus Amulumruptor caecigallinarius TaxID=2109911 RepID=A0A4Q0U8C1_9BACT|nr:MAG: dehydrogenase [Candidatus Amulumruptor caecigallinarius]HJE39995.1 dNTP triphosphohydrolase [Candidatus Amulumruptor caecigallinarius]